MAKKKEVNKTKEVQPEEVALSVKDMMDLYEKYTGLKLNPNCHLDSEFVSKWYEVKYLGGVQVKWILKRGVRITHYGDGVIYKSTNITDEIAERLMAENEAYKELFTKVED